MYRLHQNSNDILTFDKNIFQGLGSVRNNGAAEGQVGITVEIFEF